MNIDQRFVEDLLTRIEAEEEIERDKFELKREWYKLNTAQGCEELCKDISAIANTTSYDAGILLIGLDKKKGKLINSPLAKSGVSDASKLRGIIVKRIDPPPDYDFEEVAISDLEGKSKVLSVIRINPSYNKPHVLKNYKDRQNYIFIRKGTSANTANRNDLEIMFYDRSKIEPINRVEINFYRPKLNFSRKKYSDKYYILAHAYVLIENSGRRPASIIKTYLRLTYDSSDKEVTDSFEGRAWIINNSIDPILEKKGTCLHLL